MTIHITSLKSELMICTMGNGVR